MIVSEKYTVFPCPSVILPSSKICKNLSKIEGCAFSISSNNKMENGLFFTAFVSCPPDSYPTYPGGAPKSFWSLWDCPYSLISKRIQLRSSPNSFSASVFAVSVLPVPVGPAKNKTPLGFVPEEDCSPDIPVIALFITSNVLVIAISCPLTLTRKSSCAFFISW